MKRILILLLLFPAITQAQLKLFDNGGFNINSKRFYIINGSDTIASFRTDSVLIYKPTNISGGGSDGNGIYSGNGSLSGNTTITGAGNALTMTGTQSTNYAFNVNNTGNGGAIAGSSTGTGPVMTMSNSSSGTGIQGSSVSGFGVNGTSTSGIAGRFKITPSSDDDVQTIARFIRSTSGTADIGMGGSIDLALTNASGTDITTGRIKTIFTNATGSSEAADLVLSVMNSGISADRFTIKADGQIRHHAYGASGFTVTPTTTPVYASDGTVGQRVAPKIYTALLSQSGTSNPTVTVLGTNEIGSIVWTRNGVGDYTGTLTGAFTANKTFVMTQRGGDTGTGYINPWTFWGNANTINIAVLDNVNAAVDGFTNMAIEIRVYP